MRWVNGVDRRNHKTKHPLPALPHQRGRVLVSIQGAREFRGVNWRFYSAACLSARSLSVAAASTSLPAMTTP